MYTVQVIEINYLVGYFQSSENKELQEKVNILEQRLVSFTNGKSSMSSEQSVSDEYIDELRKKIQAQVITWHLFWIRIAKWIRWFWLLVGYHLSSMLL